MLCNRPAWTQDTGLKHSRQNLTHRSRKTTLCSSCGGRSSMVESKLVELVVAGSSPVGHPTSEMTNGEIPKQTEIRSSKKKTGLSSLTIRISFVIRHSPLVILVGLLAGPSV